MADACATCRFWDVYKKGVGLCSGLTEDRLGDCRRRAPRISDELLRRTMPGPSCDQFDALAENLYYPSAFPVTAAESWCGEFECHGHGESPC